VNEAGEETPLKAGVFALVNPDEKHQTATKETSPLKLSAGCRRSLSNRKIIKLEWGVNLEKG